MKKCPFCKADIEDNARFCLYCMKPLVEKETIASPKEKKRKWPLLVAGVVFLAVLLCLLLSFCSGTEEPEPIQDNSTVSTPQPEEFPDETSETVDKLPAVTLPQETSGETEPPQITEPSTAPTTKPSENSNPTMSTKPDPSPEPEPTQCDHNYTLTDLLEPTCTAAGFNAYTCGKCGDSYQESISAAGHQYAAATCLSPKICKECGQMEGDPLGHSYSDGACSRCNAPDDTAPTVIFEYRGVGPNDYFGYISESDIVITGVKSTTPDGVYEIPSHIDGKRVVGVISLAFSGSNARVVTLPETVIRVNQNAFAGCANLESLYIKSDALFLSRSAFSVPLTIYCSADCMVDDDLYGECYLKDIVRVYDAQWKEWNGE